MEERWGGKLAVGGELEGWRKGADIVVVVLVLDDGHDVSNVFKM